MRAVLADARRAGAEHDHAKSSPRETARLSNGVWMYDYGNDPTTCTEPPNERALFSSAKRDWTLGVAQKFFRSAESARCSHTTRSGGGPLSAPATTIERNSAAPQAQNFLKISLTSVSRGIGSASRQLPEISWLLGKLWLGKRQRQGNLHIGAASTRISSKLNQIRAPRLYARRHPARFREES